MKAWPNQTVWYYYNVPVLLNYTYSYTDLPVLLLLLFVLFRLTKLIFTFHFNFVFCHYFVQRQNLIYYLGINGGTGNTSNKSKKYCNKKYQQKNFLHNSSRKIVIRYATIHTDGWSNILYNHRNNFKRDQA